jgi:hypothetical protein
VTRQRFFATSALVLGALGCTETPDSLPPCVDPEIEGNCPTLDAGTDAGVKAEAGMKKDATSDGTSDGTAKD